MTEKMTFHDAEIIGLYHKKVGSKLLIHIRIPNHKKSLITFIGASEWNLSPFEKQNIIFELHQYDSKNLPKSAEKELEVPIEYIKLN